MDARWIGRTALALALAVTMWVAIGITLTFTVGRSRPQLALAWWPWGAEPRAFRAERTLERTPTGFDQAGMTAQLQAALAREPLNARAARTLGLVRSFTDPAGAARLLNYAGRLSRRDLPTELWLIESAVERGDVRGALVHYDHALRTSRGAGDVLLPTLVAASVDPPVTRALGPILRARPSWWRPFLLLAIEEGKDATSLAKLVVAFRPDLDKPEEHEIARLAIARVADLGLPVLAARLYARLTAGRPSPLAALRDGDFEIGGDLVPLDWSFTDGTDLSAVPERYAAGDTRLELRVANEARGEVARQLLVLAPGRYVLSGTMGVEESTTAALAATIAVRCTGSDRTIMAGEPRSGGATGTGFRLGFVIPAGCRSQWLTIALDGNGTAWIDKLAIVPSGDVVRAR